MRICVNGAGASGWPAHLEVDCLLYERDLRRLLRLVEERRTAA